MVFFLLIEKCNIDPMTTSTTTVTFAKIVGQARARLLTTFYNHITYKHINVYTLNFLVHLAYVVNLHFYFPIYIQSYFEHCAG